AEDGIRDLIVTGVQTCALPIFRGAEREAGAALQEGAQCVELAVGHEVPPRKLLIARAMLPRGRISVASPALAMLPGMPQTALVEIGRASCRERVRSGGGAGGWP